MDTNWAGQTHKMASGLIIPDLGRRGLFYLCSENKGVYQLRGYRETDLCVFLAHLSQRLIGELIGYSWSGVRPSSSVVVRRKQFQMSSSPKPLA